MMRTVVRMHPILQHIGDNVYHFSYNCNARVISGKASRLLHGTYKESQENEQYTQLLMRFTAYSPLDRLVSVEF